MRAYSQCSVPTPENELDLTRRWSKLPERRVVVQIESLFPPDRGINAFWKPYTSKWSSNCLRL